jgi:hypothetical protein
MCRPGRRPRAPPRAGAARFGEGGEHRLEHREVGSRGAGPSAGRGKPAHPSLGTGAGPAPAGPAAPPRAAGSAGARGGARPWSTPAPRRPDRPPGPPSRRLPDPPFTGVRRARGTRGVTPSRRSDSRGADTGCPTIPAIHVAPCGPLHRPPSGLGPPRAGPSAPCGSTDSRGAGPGWRGRPSPIPSAPRSTTRGATARLHDRDEPVTAATSWLVAPAASRQMLCH